MWLEKLNVFQAGRRELVGSCEQCKELLHHRRVGQWPTMAALVPRWAVLSLEVLT